MLETYATARCYACVSNKRASSFKRAHAAEVAGREDALDETCAKPGISCRDGLQHAPKVVLGPSEQLLISSWAIRGLQTILARGRYVRLSRHPVKGTPLSGWWQEEHSNPVGCTMCDQVRRRFDIGDGNCDVESEGRNKQVIGSKATALHCVHNGPPVAQLPQPIKIMEQSWS